MGKQNPGLFSGLGSRVRSTQNAGLFEVLAQSFPEIRGSRTPPSIANFHSCRLLVFEGGRNSRHTNNNTHNSSRRRRKPELHQQPKSSLDILNTHKNWVKV